MWVANFSQKISLTRIMFKTFSIEASWRRILSYNVILTTHAAFIDRTIGTLS